MPNNTAKIIIETAELPLHRRSADELSGVWISKESQWKDARWYLDTSTHGQLRKIAACWDVALPGGENLFDVKHEPLLDWLRRLFWSLHAAPCSGYRALKPSTLSSYSSGLTVLLPWMIEQSVLWPHQFTRDVLNHLLDDLPVILAKDTSDDEEEVITRVKASSAYRAILLIYAMWQQRKMFSEIGLKPIPEKPWPEYKGANSIATYIGTEENGWIQPLPDEVAVPILNRAVWFLGQPAADIMELRIAMDEAYHRSPSNHHNGPGITEHSRERRQRKVCENWIFNHDGDGNLWHLPLENSKVIPTQRALHLVKHLKAAAMLAIQGFVGLRPSELCGLPSGINAATGLPICIEIRPSSSGLYEVFHLKTELSKTEEVPRETTWRVGLRPVGSEEIPIVVRAILVLEKLLEPYRAISGSDRLLMSFCSSRGLPKTITGSIPMYHSRILTMYRNFIEEWVDLSTLPNQSSHPTYANDLIVWRETKGKVITSSQLRKTFALYVLSVDPRLLPAVKRQYQHVSLAMTEGGYWGNNMAQVEPVNSVSAQQTALLMYELATGSNRVAGRATERLEEGAKRVRELIKGKSIEQGWREVVKWVRQNDIRSVFASYGGCMPLATSEMECWKKGSTRPLGHQNPNYSAREPSICSGCRSFWMDARHIPAWEQRYVDNEVAYQLANHLGSDQSFRRIRDRARQANAFLRSIGHDMTGADEKIRKEVERGRKG